ncbi:hypothetical protein [Massilia endophytica]|uniref:hypothetical protein n=1 Tax=Massilia endophytica TaxID=2899220 RepID=UPI001E4AE058|nr:hypothetical protein [Massilia endophytica]UGQ48831.1 hypothetical protein LSQ66_10330 [Massilia endophytica]
MRELFLSECRRFRMAALIAAGVHLTLLFVISRLTLVMQMDWRRHFVMLMAYGLAGAIFGAYQFGTYRQPARWVWLMHRPLPRWRICAAIACASALMLLIAIGLPGMLMLAITQAATARVVDVHHYFIVLYVTLFSMAAWLCGSYAMLSRSKLAIVLLLLPCVLMLHLASAFSMLAVGAATVLLLAAIAYFAMKPNRFAPPQGTAATLATALPLQIGFYFALLWAGGFGAQYLMIMAGTHPLNSSVAPAGGFVEAVRAKHRDLIAKGLDAASDPRAAQWKAQLPAAVVTPVRIEYPRFPVLHELSLDSPMAWYEEPTNTIWSFSHDHMAFQGQDMFTGAPRGKLGMDGASQPFAAPPVVDQNGMQLVLPHEVLAFDSKARRWQPIMRLPGGETVLGLRTRVEPAKYRHEYALTTKRFIAWRDVAGPMQQAEERYSIPLPGAPAEVQRVDIATLADGEIVSFLFGRNTIDGAPDGVQVVMRVDANGKAEQLARRPLNHDYPMLFEHREWWLSPPLHALLALPDLLLDQGETMPLDTVAMARPPGAWAASLTASLLSALGAWWWLRASRVPVRSKAVWITCCLVIGVPCLLCLLVMQERLSPAVRARLHAGLPQAA